MHISAPLRLSFKSITGDGIFTISKVLSKGFVGFAALLTGKCSYLSLVAAFAFVTLSLASGLLYVSELIEEHSRLAKIWGKRGIYVRRLSL